MRLGDFVGAWSHPTWIGTHSQCTRHAHERNSPRARATSAPSIHTSSLEGAHKRWFNSNDHSPDSRKNFIHARFCLIPVVLLGTVRRHMTELSFFHEVGTFPIAVIWSWEYSIDQFVLRTHTFVPNWPLFQQHSAAWRNWVVLTVKLMNLAHANHCSRVIQPALWDQMMQIHFAY